MERSQWYVGVPNGVVLCVDYVTKGNEPCGRLYHSYSRETMPFTNMDEVLFYMERLYDSLCYPYPTTHTRSFLQEPSKRGYGQERTKIMKDEELLSQHGELGSFIIRVQHRQNSSWQGRITWMEQNKTLYFRSIWEMIKMIGSAVEPEGEKDEISWFAQESTCEKG